MKKNSRIIIAEVDFPRLWYYLLSSKPSMVSKKIKTKASMEAHPLNGKIIWIVLFQKSINKANHLKFYL